MKLFLSVCAACAVAGTVAWAASQVNDAAVSGSGAATLLTVAPLHSQGPGAISQVAVEITGDGGNWTFPNLNDSGASGDASSGDGVWSLSVDLSAAPAGSYAAIFYVLDNAGDETVGEPVAFTVP